MQYETTAQDGRSVDHQREPCPHRIIDGMLILFERSCSSEEKG